MNLSWLNDFLALASSGNFSRAAEERNMTQPAFGRRIRALEEWLGVVLFDRTSHPVSLTDTGEWFRAVAREIVERVDRVPEEARAVADANSAKLRIASTHALSFTFLPSWLRTLESRTTIGPIQLASDVMQQCETLLLQGRVQFLLSYWHEVAPARLDPRTHCSIKVGSDTVMAVSAPATGGGAKFMLSREESVGVPILAYSSESGIGRIVQALSGAALEKVRVKQVFTAHLASVLKTMALEGRGICWLPVTLIREELATGRLVVAGGEEWSFAVDIRLFRGQAPLPRAAEAFWTAASQAAPPDDEQALASASVMPEGLHPEPH